ncbi:MAG: type II toxin-antitoxin system HigB family toxin [Candidatus Sericytochromatia bacterium]|nr:type II toxin-antitoxin system HigB family toxin [Candidatus Sericytochromatia bacterium]
MRVIAYKTLTRFLTGLAGRAEQDAVAGALGAWYEEVRRATWKTPADVKLAYRNASIVGSDRLVFNIKGNDFRLVVAVDYGRQIVFVKWFGTHEAYDRIDVRTVSYGD